MGLFNFYNMEDTKKLSKFVNVKLHRTTVEDMISTYEFFVWSNTGEEKKDAKRILNALKKSLETNNMK